MMLCVAGSLVIIDTHVLACEMLTYSELARRSYDSVGDCRRCDGMVFRNECGAASCKRGREPKMNVGVVGVRATVFWLIACGEGGDRMV